MDIYIVPSSATCFSVVLFCLTFCACGLISAGCMAVEELQVPLASAVCPLVGKIGPGTCVGFLDWFLSSGGWN